MKTLTKSFLTLLLSSSSLFAAAGDDRPVKADPEVGCKLDKEEAAYVKSFEGKYQVPLNQPGGNAVLVRKLKVSSF